MCNRWLQIDTPNTIIKLYESSTCPTYSASYSGYYTCSPLGGRCCQVPTVAKARAARRHLQR